MLKRLLAVLFTIIAIIAAGYLALRRADIPYDTLEAVYANEDSQFMTLGGEARLHYRDLGSRDAPTLLLVHGFSASLHTWEPWVDTLARDYRVVSIDLPGHGLTRCPDVNQMGIPHFVDIADQAMETLGADKFTIIGNSMGGATAWNYTLTHPEKVEALVLVDASGWPKAEDGDTNTPFVFKLLANPFARRIMKDLDMSGLIRSGLEDSFSDKTLVTDRMVERYASLNRAPCHRQAILTLMSENDERPVASEERLASITAPTLIMHGAEDNLVPVQDAQRFADAISGAEVKIYDGVGHLPQEEISETSVNDLKAFLTRTIDQPEPVIGIE